MIRFIYVSIAALALAACAMPAQIKTLKIQQNISPGPGPEGRLQIMGKGLNFNLQAPPKDWLIITQSDTENLKTPFKPLSSVTRGGVATLEIRTGPTQSVAVRRINAMLMATPYLSWDWNLSDNGTGVHPVRLVIGFNGGVPDGTTTRGKEGGLPIHDRALTLVWGDTALKRGTLTRPNKNRPFEAAVYTVRGGRENTRQWWRDTVDLSELYKKAWPNDKRRTIRITFIGVAAAPRMPAVRGRVSAIELSH